MAKQKVTVVTKSGAERQLPKSTVDLLKESGEKVDVVSGEKSETKSTAKATTKAEPAKTTAAKSETKSTESEK